MKERQTERQKDRKTEGKKIYRKNQQTKKWKEVRERQRETER
jgi:hypothetical protein